VAVFPGTLERIFGIDYDFMATWGVSQAAFEVFTLGTLAVLGLLGAVGYLRAKPVRAERPVTAELGEPTDNVGLTTGNAGAHL
jgi:hypothetical protein